MVVAKMNTNTTFLLLSSSIFLRTWMRKWTKNLISTPNSLVILYIDKFFKYLDKLFKGEASPCGKIGISETLRGKQKKLKEMIDLLEFVGKLLSKNKGFKAGYANSENQKKVCVNRLRNRWSDCGCDPCITCMKINDPKLHIVVKEASSKGTRNGDSCCPTYEQFYHSCCADHYEDHYLDGCSICGKSLHNSDIFMYRGNIPFCSTECRQEQMEIDEVRENKLRFDRYLRKSDYKNSMPNKIVPMRIITVP